MILDPLWVSVTATVVLVIINVYYAYELRKSRIESNKPLFSLRPGMVIKNEPLELYLLNTGGVAKNVNVDTYINGIKKDLLFIASIPTNGDVKLEVRLDEIKREKGRIDVKLYYETSYGKSDVDTLNIDYNLLESNERKIGYNYSVIEKMLERISNSIILLHNDAESGRFKSDRITVYSEKKPERRNRKK